MAEAFLAVGVIGVCVAAVGDTFHDYFHDRYQELKARREEKKTREKKRRDKGRRREHRGSEHHSSASRASREPSIQDPQHSRKSSLDSDADSDLSDSSFSTNPSKFASTRRVNRASSDNFYKPKHNDGLSTAPAIGSVSSRQFPYRDAVDAEKERRDRSLSYTEPRPGSQLLIEDGPYVDPPDPLPPLKEQIKPRREPPFSREQDRLLSNSGLSSLSIGDDESKRRPSRRARPSLRCDPGFQPDINEMRPPTNRSPVKTIPDFDNSPSLTRQSTGLSSSRTFSSYGPSSPQTPDHTSPAYAVPNYSLPDKAPLGYKPWEHSLSGNKSPGYASSNFSPTSFKSPERMSRGYEPPKYQPQYDISPESTSSNQGPISFRMPDYTSPRHKLPRQSLPDNTCVESPFSPSLPPLSPTSMNRSTRRDPPGYASSGYASSISSRTPHS